MKVILQNDFHLTTAKVEVDDEQSVLSPNQYNRAMRKLCGIKCCYCGGLRGKITDEQDNEIDYMFQFVSGRQTIELLGYVK